MKNRVYPRPRKTDLLTLNQGTMTPTRTIWSSTRNVTRILARYWLLVRRGVTLGDRNEE
ncbi:hypothetical protein AG1IA_04999 [Rhizoctonia solani AG-1 IA]|uniref:Uncharacterized protein n=1 Tax=Thanatephorus cucumeris (strain AG1-IA) TaxID=983506 RepID=L8WX91_THACA|nr:hypothetical protein AG1IA_04999 [Rhizoctonia solani AG-1 IA]